MQPQLDTEQLQTLQTARKQDDEKFLPLYAELLGDFFEACRGKKIKVLEIGCGVNPKHIILNKIATEHDVELFYVGIDIDNTQINICNTTFPKSTRPPNTQFMAANASHRLVLGAQQLKSIDLVLSKHPAINGDPLLKWNFKLIFQNTIPGLLKPNALLLTTFFNATEREIFDNEMVLANKGAAKNIKVASDGLTTITQYSPRYEEIYGQERVKKCTRYCGFFAVAAAIVCAGAVTAYTTIQNTISRPRP